MSKKWNLPSDYNERFTNKIKEIDKLFGVNSFKKSSGGKGCLVGLVILISITTLIIYIGIIQI